MRAALAVLSLLALVARPCKPYTDPEGVRLLQDLREAWIVIILNFKGGSAPQGWAGSDPCGSLWEGVECSADGHVLNVALPDWLPQRQLLQLLTEQETEVLEKAIGVTGTVGDINAAIGRRFPAGSSDSDSSSQVVGPTINAIKSGLESLLPYSTAGASVIPSIAPVAANPILLAPTPAESPLAMFAPVIGMTGMSPAAGVPAASGTSSPGIAPSMSAAGEGSSEGSQTATANPGEALSELLTEIELIKEKLRMQADAGRRLLAEEESMAPSVEETMAPAVAPMMQTLPTISSPPVVTNGMSQASGQPLEAISAEAPQRGVEPELLPEGDTDITAVQKAVGNDKGIGRRLAAAFQFYVGSPAPGPEGGYQEILAPETAPAGHESPAKVDSKIIKNPDGSTSVQLGEGSIGNFTLPTVNGTIPAQNGVKLIFGRKMLQDVKPASTLLSFSSASAPSASSKAIAPTEGPAEGPSEGGYQQVLAPKSAPTGESSPESPGLAVKLPPLQVGPIKLPAVNTTLPPKQEGGLPGRKRLQEAYAPLQGPAEGPWAYQEIIAPQSAPKGEGSPGGVTLPDIGLGNFKLPEVTLPLPPPKKEPVP